MIINRTEKWGKKRTSLWLNTDESSKDKTRVCGYNKDRLKIYRYSIFAEKKTFGNWQFSEEENLREQKNLFFRKSGPSQIFL